MSTLDVNYEQLPEIKKEVLTFDWSVVNRLKELLNSSTTFYDPLKQVYVLNGVQISDEFLNGICSNYSHVINSISNMRLKKKVIVNIDTLHKEL
jgi:hypothetical protein